MGERGLFTDDISLENGNGFEGNDMCSDWVEIFCEYNIDDRLDGSICHLSEMDEECLSIFSVSILDCHDDDIKTCVIYVSHEKYQ